ncbi:carotenoid biosynthesis protein [Rhodococcus rhodnii]|nr:carotenoid biosynthesis protein [Rhodococcus rhodnii]TXG92764.1 carotenoid biosynthesis protein [Rhodococcus rhodnii]
MAASIVGGAAIAAQILYPLVSGRALDAVTVAVVVLLASASIVHALATRGLRFAVVLVVATAGVGYASEVLGTITGIPYGAYHYVPDGLGPVVADVPVVVPFAWTAGFYPVWIVATIVCSRLRPRMRAVARVPLVAVGMVGWDLYLDPQMVADGRWVWHRADAGLPGLEHIPLTNYAGWFAVAILMAIVVTVGGGDGARRGADLARDALPVVLFAWTWLGSALAHAVFLDAPELRWSAMYGFVGMGLLGVPAVVVFAARTHRTPPTAGQSGSRLAR